MPVTSRGPVHTAGVQIRLLGGFSVLASGRQVEDADWRLRKARNLVKLLAIVPGHRLHRERIVDLFWPELSAEAGANNLRQIVHAARRVLEPTPLSGPHYLLLHDDFLELCPPDQLWTDVEAFEFASSAARRTWDIAAYRSALELYPGDLLPDDPYEDWAIARREELRSLNLSLLNELSRLYEDLGENLSAIETLQRVVALDPIQEEAHVRLMRLHALGGRRHAVRHQYRRLKDALQRELDVEPDPASEALYREILGGKFPGSAAGASHRATVDQAEARQHNLPVPLTSFIGREQEIASICRLLLSARLVTVVGVGGSGKTRLALEVARAQLPNYPDGVWLVDLSSLSNPDMLSQTVARQIGIRELPGKPLVDTLAGFLSDRTLLLVLDNCEHLASACADFAAAALAVAPELRIVATGRQALNVPGEATWRITSLSLPGLGPLPGREDPLRFEAIRLFVERAQLVRSEFQLEGRDAAAVVEICRRLDGMPLAIELAAARIKVLSVEQIAHRLEDRFRLLRGESTFIQPRHQTLRAAIDWSYNLLGSEEQRLFEHLSVFAGGCTLEAAETVCCAPDSSPITHHTPHSSVLDDLSRLVDRSLVVVEEGEQESRYRMLETVRQYARERLAEQGYLDEAEARHADFYARLAEQAEPELVGPKEPRWVSTLEREHDNLRAALDRSIKTGRIELALGIGAALHQFWWLRGYYREGREWLERSLKSEACQRSQGLLTDRRGRARALDAAGLMAQCQGAWADGRVFYQESLALWRELREPERAGSALTNLGMLALYQGQFDEARSLLEQSLAVQREIGNRWGTAYALVYLAMFCCLTRDHPRAWSLLDETEALFREFADKRGIGAAMGLRGWLSIETGDHAVAWKLSQESVRILSEAGERWILVLSLEGCAGAAAMTGEDVLALRLAGSAAALRESAGGVLPPVLATLYDRWLEPARRGLGKEAIAAAWAEGRAMTVEESVSLALSTECEPEPPAVHASVKRNPLTSRESAVASLVARGLTNRRIAAELAIGEGTVANHVEHILRKLDLSSRSQVAAWAVERQFPMPSD